MQKYADFILDVLGIDDPIKIVVDDSIPLAKFVVNEENIPSILLNLSNCKNEINTRTFLTHELRHYYQWLVVFNKNYCDFEEENTRLLWKSNIKNYVPFEESKKYTHQVIEIDAVCFTQLIMQTIYGIVMNDFKKEDASFLLKLNELGLDFTQEELKEVMHLHGIKKEKVII